MAGTMAFQALARGPPEHDALRKAMVRSGPKLTAQEGPKGG